MAKKRFDDGGQALLDKTKASLARKQAGIEDREEPTYLGSVKSVLQGYKDKAVDALTPNTVKVVRQKQQEMQDAADAPGNKKGGQVKRKAKSRGNGVASKGLTKGRVC